MPPSWLNRAREPSAVNATLSPNVNTWLALVATVGLRESEKITAGCAARL